MFKDFNLNPKKMVYYTMFFGGVIAVLAIMSVISGQPIDWVQNTFVSMALTALWIISDVLVAKRQANRVEAEKKNAKHMSKAEKKAIQKAQEAREKREAQARKIAAENAFEYEDHIEVEVHESKKNRKKGQKKAAPTVSTLDTRSIEDVEDHLIEQHMEKK